MRILTTLAFVTTLVLLAAGCKPEGPTTEPNVEPAPAPATEPVPTRDNEPAPAPARDNEPAAAPTPDSPPDAAPIETDRPFIQDDDGNRIPVTVGAAPGYIPDGACKGCHALLFDDYQHVGMARSVYKPTEQNIIENYEDNTFYHEASDRHYEMSHRDGAFYQKRYQIGPNGERVNELEAKVDLVIGSGKTVRTYATRDAAGELYQLPISWYSQTRRWGMSPGYDTAHHPGFTRLIKRECMFCHNAYPEQPARSDIFGQPFAYPPDLPDGIGCQRCHGPGAEHVRIAYTPTAGIRETRASIVNPARLAPKLRDDVCNQCHLQPSSSPTSFMRLTGRSDYSYVPGEPIENYMLIVDYPTAGGKSQRFEINHQAYRLYQSPCYLNADGAMSCLTCHDPHRKPAETDKVAYYRDKCLTCHGLDDCGAGATTASDGADHADANDCVSCHMPKHRAEDVIQVLATDHLIRRDPAPPEWIAPRRERGRPIAPMPHAESPDRVPDESTLSLHLALFAGVQNRVEQLDELRAAIQNAGAMGARAYLYQARLEEAAGQYKEAERTYRRLIDQVPDVLGAYTGLAYALQRQERYDEALKPAHYAVDMNPVAADAYQVLGTALLALGRVNEAGPVLQRAVQLRPYHVDARSNLAKAFISIGDFESALTQYKAILAVDPVDTPTYVDLASLLVSLGRRDEAVERLQHGISLRPNGRALYETRAMALVMADRFDEALEASAEARRRGGDVAVCDTVDSLVYVHKGENAKARSMFRSGSAKGPSSEQHGSLYRLVRERAREAFKN